MDKWAIIVVRSNGTDVEVLEHLFKSPAEARQHALHFLERVQGVTMEVVKVTIPMQGEAVTRSAD